MAENKQEEKKNQDNDESILKTFYWILGILFFPSLIIASLFFYITVVKKRQVKAVLHLITWSTVAVITIIDFIFKLTPHIFTFNGSFLFWISITFMYVRIGFILGLIYSLIQLYNLEKNPRLKLLYDWAENFKYEKPFWVKKKIEEDIIKLQNGDYLNDEDLAPLGILIEDVRIVEDNKIRELDEYQVVYRYPKEALLHTLITGGSGSGKSKTMSQLIENDVKSNIGVCLIDNKKSADMVYLCSMLAKKYNKKFYHFTSGRPEDYINPLGNFQATYDPLASGDGNSKVDLVLNMRSWDTSSDMYKTQNKSMLQSLFYLLENSDRKNLPNIEWNKGGFIKFASSLTKENVLEMIEQLRIAMSKKDPQMISAGEKEKLRSLEELSNVLIGSRTSEEKNQLQQLATMMRTFILSDYSDWLYKQDGIPHIDLRRIILEEDSPIVLFSFNPQEEKDTARAMGSIIMSDLSRVSAEKTAIKNNKVFRVYIDEFQTLPIESVKDNLEKARTSKMGFTLSLQSLQQVALESSMTMVHSISETISTIIVHSGISGVMAEFVSDLTGEGYVTKYALTGDKQRGLLKFFNKKKNKVLVNEKEELRNVVEKAEITKLLSGEVSGESHAYLINKACADPLYADYPGVITRKVKIVVTNELLEGIPDHMKAIYKEMEEEKFKRKREKEALLDEDLKERLIPDGDWGIEEVEEQTPSVPTTMPKIRSSRNNYFTKPGIPRRKGGLK